MSKTMQINPPAGFKFQSVDQSSGAINLVEIPKDIKERIQTIDDVFALNNTTQYDFKEKWNGFEDHEIYNALEILIVAAYNDNNGKLPDFTDGTTKYYPIFNMGSPSGVGFSSATTFTGLRFRLSVPALFFMELTQKPIC